MFGQVTHFAWSHDGRMAVIAYQVRTTGNNNKDVIRCDILQPLELFWFILPSLSLSSPLTPLTEGISSFEEGLRSRPRRLYV